MLRDILLLVWSCSVVLCQNDETPSSLSETAFGEKTFVPEIVPLSVKRSLTESGELNITIEVIFSEDFVISWVAHISPISYLDRIYSPVTETVPNKYTLQILIPTKANQHGNLSSTSFSLDETEDTADEVFKMEDDDVLIDNNELYINFHTLNLPEAVVLKLSLDDVNFDNDEDVDNTPAIDEAVPKFPEMEELGLENIIVTTGTGTQVPIEILFTDEDRFSVRGLVYNSTSNRIFTTLWSTSFLLGPSDFYKIPNGYDNGSDDFHDNVSLENIDSDESSTIMRISIDIPTENNDISGVYTIRAHHEAHLREPSFISVSSLEQTFTVQTENQTHGPIPPEVIEFADGPYSQVTCRIGQPCLVTCHVLGIAVQSLELMHKDENSEFVTLPQGIADYGTYESQVTALVDSTKPANSGTHICKVVSGQISLNKEIDVNFVHK